MASSDNDTPGTMDEVEETVFHRQMGVKVEKVTRHGYEEDVEYTKIYAKRKNRYGSLTGDGTEVHEHYVQIAEFPGSVATEVLFGLAEAHGYNLEAE